MDEEAERLRREWLKARIVRSILAAVYQGNKVLDLFEAQRKRDKSRTALDPLNTIFNFLPWNHETRCAICRAEENFYLFALRDLYRWSDIGVKYLMLPEEVFAPLKQSRQVVIDARDMREHEDEYQGFGRPPQRPHRWVATADFTEVGHKEIAASASWTTAVGGKIMIANRVDVAATIRECIEVANRLASTGQFEEFRKAELSMIR